MIDENDGMIQISNANFNDNSFKVLYSSQKIKNGMASFNISMIGKVKTLYQLIIMYSVGNVEISQNFSIWLDSCSVGEYQSNLCQGDASCTVDSANYINSQCVKCRIGFYSLNPNMECTICVDNAKCPGGSLLLPISGYWRSDENSSKILKCANINLCPDQSNFLHTSGSKFNFICGNGSFGNLCALCDDGYGVSTDKSCIHCRPDAKVIILVIFNFFVLFDTFVSFLE